MTEHQRLSSRWRRQPRIQEPDIVVSSGQPLAQITIYDDLTLLTRQERGRWTSHPISSSGLAETLAQVPTTTGLLPLNTLGSGRIAGTPFYALFVPPTVRTLRTEQAEYRIPVPALLWAGAGQDYRIWALDSTSYPTQSEMPLYLAPFPNCYLDGRICWGSTDPRPNAAPSVMLPTLDLFLEASYFNQHLANGKSKQFSTSVIAQWEALATQKKREYPVRDLVGAQLQLRWVLDGGPWGGGA